MPRQSYKFYYIACDFVYIHYIDDYNQGTVQDYIDMAKVIQDSFPNTSLSKIWCGRVSKSQRFENHPIVVMSFSHTGDFKAPEGWELRESCDYLWQ